jgi:nitric oxide reductase NorQ protein
MTEEKNSLKEILQEVHEGNDPFFDELQDVTSEEDKPKTAQQKKTKKPARKKRTSKTSKKTTAKKKTSAAKAVAEVMRAVEPDWKANASERAEAKSSLDASELLPVKRPSGEEYRPRPLGHLTDVSLVREARAVSSPVLLSGYPGCGKTALIEAAFAGEMITAHAHGDMEVTDLVGTYTQQPDGTYLWVDGPLVEAMKKGRVLFVDDITLAPATVLARLYPAMDGRGEIRVVEHENETVRAKKGFFVVGAHNPGAPGAILSEALASRFLLPLQVESDFSMALDMGIDSRIVMGATALRKMRDGGDGERIISWAPEMRELLAFQKNKDAFGENIAIGALIGAAPEETRDTIASTLRTWFPDAEILRLAA